MKSTSINRPSKRIPKTTVSYAMVVDQCIDGVRTTVCNVRAKLDDLFLCDFVGKNPRLVRLVGVDVYDDSAVWEAIRVAEERHLTVPI